MKLSRKISCYVLLASFALAPTACLMGMARRSSTQLVDAAGRGDERRVRELVASGVGVNSFSMDGDTALTRASFHKREDVIRTLLALGADPNCANGRCHWPPLLLAAEIGFDLGVELLLDGGAAVDGVDRGGMTALFAAARDDREAMTRRLLAYGADVNHLDRDGRTALSHAAESGSVRVAGLLLEHGAMIENIDHWLRTPLFYAAKADRSAMVRFLQACDANMSCMDRKGLTPLAIATVEGNELVVRILLEAGADLYSHAACCDFGTTATANRRQASKKAKRPRDDEFGTELCRVCSQEIDGAQLVRSCPRHRVCRQCLELWNRHRGDSNSCPQCASVNR